MKVLGNTARQLPENFHLPNTPLAQDVKFLETRKLKLLTTNVDINSRTKTPLETLFDYLKGIQSNNPGTKVCELLNSFVKVTLPNGKDIPISPINVERFFVPDIGSYRPIERRLGLTSSSTNELNESKFLDWNTAIARQNSHNLVKLLEPSIKELRNARKSLVTIPVSDITPTEVLDEPITRSTNRRAIQIKKKVNKKLIATNQYLVCDCSKQTLIKALVSNKLIEPKRLLEIILKSSATFSSAHEYLQPNELFGPNLVRNKVLSELDRQWADFLENVQTPSSDKEYLSKYKLLRPDLVKSGQLPKFRKKTANLLEKPHMSQTSTNDSDSDNLLQLNYKPTLTEVHISTNLISKIAFTNILSNGKIAPRLIEEYSGLIKTNLRTMHHVLIQILHIHSRHKILDSAFS